MKEDSSANRQNKKAIKKEIRIDYQKSTKFIDEIELKKKGGITGDKTHLFKGFLRIFNNGEIHHKYDNNMIGIAKFIFHRRILYVKTKHGYKLMKISSIINDLHKLSKTVIEEMENELKEKENNKYRRY